VLTCLQLPNELFWNQLVDGLSGHEIDMCQDSSTGCESSNSEIEQIISSELLCLYELMEVIYLFLMQGS
jgi:hypothetical protein